MEQLKAEHREAVSETEKRNARTRDRTIALIADKVRAKLVWGFNRSSPDLYVYVYVCQL